MRFLLLIYGPEDSRTEPFTDEWHDLIAAYGDFNQEIDRRGVHVASQALQWTASASTVRRRDEETIITDGPFAETKEALAGFYLVDVADRNEALELAALIPGAAFGSIEVRPILELGT